jgi:hypothetical protein
MDNVAASVGLVRINPDSLVVGTQPPAAPFLANILS